MHHRLEIWQFFFSFYCTEFNTEIKFSVLNNNCPQHFLQPNFKCLIYAQNTTLCLLNAHPAKKIIITHVNLPQAGLLGKQRIQFTCLWKRAAGNEPGNVEAV